jgi:hypothetical protein
LQAGFQQRERGEAAKGEIEAEAGFRHSKAPVVEKKPYTPKKGLTTTLCVIQTPIEQRNTSMPTEAKPFAPNLPNIHPADELAAMREEIKQMQTRADELRDMLLADGADLKGDQYTAAIIPGVRETLDRKAIEEAFGAKAIAPFLKSTHFKTVKLVEN